MFDRDLTTAGIPAYGKSCRHRRGVRRTARKNPRDESEPGGPAQLHTRRNRPAHPTAGRRRSLRTGHPPDLPPFLADPHETGQPDPVRDGLRRYRVTVRTRSGPNRGNAMRPAIFAPALFTADAPTALAGRR